MNKNILTITGVSVFILLFAAVFMVFGNNSNNQSNNNQQVTTEPTTTEQLEQDMQELPSQQDLQQGDYSITNDSSVSYVVQKRFLNRADEEVTGTTTNVTGSGSFDNETGEFSLQANVDLTTLDTGSSGRDNEIAELFTPNNAVIVISSQNNPNFDASLDNQEIIAQVTINNVTKELPLQAQITLNEDQVSATGETTFNMSEFNINPPSAAGIYTVDDQTTVVFNITATK